MKWFERHVIVPRRMRWVEDSAPMSLIDTGGSTSFIGTAVGEFRIVLFGIIAFLCLCVIGVRVVQLQIIERDKWLKIAEQNRLHTQPIIPERGIIFDRNMMPLVSNAPNFRLTIRAQDLPRDAVAREKHIRELGATIGVSTERIEQILTAFQKYRYARVVVKDPITYDEAVSVYLKSSAFPSLTIERSAKRNYVAGIPGLQSPLPESFSHVLGYLGRISPDELENLSERSYFPTDLIGKTGIESLYESYLRGIPGQRGAEVDSRGAEQRTVSVDDPVAGSSIVLSLDYEIQQALERALRHGMNLAKQARGSAVAVDPRDGSILGLVSLPAYDNNVFAGTISSDEYTKLVTDPNQPLLNRAVSGQFAAGSTMKPFIAAAALQEGIVTPETTVQSTGGVYLGRWFFPDWKAGGHGTVNVRKAIAESVNTFFYLVGGGIDGKPGLGPEKIKQYLEYFGFGRTTESDLIGEASGFIPSPEWKQEVRGEQWYPGDTYNMSIGQGDILITPLQLAMAVSAIANEGTLWEPHIMKYRLGSHGEEYVVPPQIRAKIPVDVAWLKEIKAGMRDTVLAGSARSLQTIPVSIAGKTGTAQWSSTKNNHAWFESFAPYENPEIVTVFLIEEGIEGSSVAVPAAREFYSWWATYRQGT